MKFTVPHTFSIIFILIAIVALATWVIPSGKYTRIIHEKTGKEIVVPNSYKAVPANPQNPANVLQAFGKGMMDASEIIVFLLILGGAYGVVLETKALDRGFKRVIEKLGNSTKLLIPIIVILFAIGGTATGVWEETLAFFLIIVPLLIAVGYDALVGISVILVGAGIGNMASITNPFSTGIASGIAEIPMSEGIIIRIVLWIVAVLVAIIYIMIYATKIKQNPKKSLIYNLYDDHKKHFSHLTEAKADSKFTGRDKLIVAAFTFNIIFMMFSIMVLDWWVIEITMQFIIMAWFCGLVSGMKEKEIWDNFIKGGQDFLFAAYVVGLARGVYIILNDGLVMDTLLHYLTILLASVPKEIFLSINQIAQLLIGFFIPSSSGQAALVIPILSPMVEVLHIPKASIIISYTVASGLINLITPVSGILMAALVLCRTPFSAWLRFIIPLFIIEVVVGLIAVIASMYLL